MSFVPCPQCYDPKTGENLGYYSYDENHSTFCDLCCSHSQGWWLLSEFHADPGAWCCRAGCGHTISPEEYAALLNPTPDYQRSRPSPLAG
jgi:hypothetical protein